MHNIFNILAQLTHNLKLNSITHQDLNYNYLPKLVKLKENSKFLNRLKRNHCPPWIRPSSHSTMDSSAPIHSHLITPSRSTMYRLVSTSLMSTLPTTISARSKSNFWKETALLEAKAKTTLLALNLNALNTTTPDPPNILLHPVHR